MAVTWPDVTAFRLERHGLTRPLPRTRWLDAVSAIGGLHAQVMSAAELALAVRVKGLPAGQVSGALWRDRSLVKTWAMRGTLHLIATRDFPELVAGLSTLRHFLRPSWLKYFELTAAEINALFDAVPAVLSDEGISRERLATRLVRRMKAPHLAEHLQSGWGTLLKPAAFRGGLCFGPNEGTKVSFVNPAAWLGRFDRPDPKDALRNLLRRYLSAYGPAPADDFARWLGLDVATAKRLYRELGDELVPVVIEGFRGHLLAADLPAVRRAEPPPGATLLPYFDPYTVAASRQARYLFPARFRLRVYRPQGWISPVVLWNGRMVGTWDSAARTGPVEVRLFEKLPPAAKSAVADRVGRLLNRPAAVR